MWVDWLQEASEQEGSGEAIGCRGRLCQAPEKPPCGGMGTRTPPTPGASQ